MKIAKRAGLKEQPLGQELMVVDEKTDKVHVLNPTSAFIWGCLDDTSEQTQIEARLRAKFNVPADFDVLGLVGRALQQFQEKNLVTTAASGQS